MADKRIVIIGAGPTGLGAGYRLRELGHSNWAIYEKNNYVGGLSASFTDEIGFMWDIGGHVLFSRYEYFDRLFDRMMAGEYFEHLRKAYIRVLDRWVPYPFQNNIRHLPREALLECLTGLIDTLSGPSSESAPTFLDWIYAVLGSGIAKHFMVPYNNKIWSYPLELMDKKWVADTVSVVDVKKVLRNVILGLDEVGWGINRTFKFSRRGGTGELFRRMEPYVAENLRYCKTAVEIDMEKHRVIFADGSRETYDALINTSPLHTFVRMLVPVDSALRGAAEQLRHNGVIVVGIGLRKKLESDMCWIYFPGQRSPFYRATYLSNYSPFNVPHGDTQTHCSIMCEMSYFGDERPTNKEAIEQTIQGLINEGLIDSADRDVIVSTYLIDAQYAYPIPTLDRDKALRLIQPQLEARSIYSRGRFGGWKYEIPHMDHSVMMGVEVVDRILTEKPEQTWSL